jgi:hypothetical protein
VCVASLFLWLRCVCVCACVRVCVCVCVRACERAYVRVAPHVRSSHRKCVRYDCGCFNFWRLGSIITAELCPTRPHSMRLHDVVKRSGYSITPTQRSPRLHRPSSSALQRSHLVSSGGYTCCSQWGLSCAACAPCSLQHQQLHLQGFNRGVLCAAGTSFSSIQHQTSVQYPGH